MRQEENKYFRLRNQSYHPDNNGKIAFFFSFISRLTIEQFIFFKNIKDLIFPSGLFFVPQFVAIKSSKIQNQSRTNHIELCYQV